MFRIARTVKVSATRHRSERFNKVKRTNRRAIVALVALVVVEAQIYGATAAGYDVGLPSGATNDVLVRCPRLDSKNEGFVARRPAGGPV